MKLFRWLMVVPSGFIAWYVVLFIGVAFLGATEIFCPKNLMVSGSCMADWWEVAYKTILILFSGLSAIGVVIFPALVAPSHKNKIALLSYSVGAVFAFWFAVSLEAWFELVSALMFGGITLAIMLKIFGNLPKADMKS